VVFGPARDPSLTRVAAFGAAKIGAVTAAISTFSTPAVLIVGRKHGPVAVALLS
jgi:hypothetical protein